MVDRYSHRMAGSSCFLEQTDGTYLRSLAIRSRVAMRQIFPPPFPGPVRIFPSTGVTSPQDRSRTFHLYPIFGSSVAFLRCKLDGSQAASRTHCYRSSL